MTPLVLATQACARDAAEEGAPFVTFTEREGADFEAFSSRIIPSDDTAGAREANVVYFVDQALQASAIEPDWPLSHHSPELSPRSPDAPARLDPRAHRGWPDGTRSVAGRSATGVATGRRSDAAAAARG